MNKSTREALRWRTQLVCCLFSPLTQLSVVGREVTVLSMNKIQERNELRAPNRWVAQFVFFYKNRPISKRLENSE